jgi:hypothetical protein
MRGLVAGVARGWAIAQCRSPRAAVRLSISNRDGGKLLDGRICLKILSINSNGVVEMGSIAAASAVSDH